MNSLDELLDAILAGDARLPRAHGEIDMSALPTFGGLEPVDTAGVWSWDQSRLLVGGGSNDLEIVSKQDA